MIQWKVSVASLTSVCKSNPKTLLCKDISS
jgi:hypothetical protein